MLSLETQHVCEALRSPDFAGRRILHLTDHKLCRAGCSRPRPSDFANVLFVERASLANRNCKRVRSVQWKFLIPTEVAPRRRQRLGSLPAQPIYRMQMAEVPADLLKSCGSLAAAILPSLPFAATRKIERPTLRVTLYLRHWIFSKLHSNRSGESFFDSVRMIDSCY
jgi:hypothetical protein